MNTSLKPLDQQVIVVTGASSGIGLATVLLAAQASAKVVMLARSGETLARIAEHVQAEGGEAVPVVGDVAEAADVQRAVETAIARFGRIDTWVNNAGLSIYGRMDQVPVADARRLFDINYWGVVHGSLAALPHLRRDGGALINVGSEVSDAAVPLQGHYSASKHAVKGFTDTLRIELEADEAAVSVTLIQPTAVDTPFPEHAANHLSQAPKLPTPMIDPARVARAILDAATRPTRHTRVGAMAVLNTTLARVMPRLADAMARVQLGRQQREEPAPAHTGTLWQAGEAGHVHGRGNEDAAGPTQAYDANVRKDE